MSSSASSLHFLSLAPKTLSLPNSNHSLSSSASFPLSSPSLKAPKSISISASFLHASARPARFVPNVALSSDVEQDEDDFGDVEQPRFSPDLKLFVGNLPFNVDSATLAELFEQAGTVEMVEVIYDKMTGRSRGFGFVTMSTVQEVEAAAEQLNGYELGGRPMRVNSGPPPPKDSFRGDRGDRGSFRGDRDGGSFRGNRDGGSFRGDRDGGSFRGDRDGGSFRGGARGGGGGGGGGGYSNTNRLYVGNLSFGVDNAALETLFREQGNVMEAKVVYDRDSGRSRGFGFVTYSSAQEVNNAIESLDGVDLDGRSIRVSVAEARPPRQF